MKNGHYSDLLSNKIFDTNNIKLILFFDGVSYSKSNNSNSHNAILFSIAQLPFALRNSHSNRTTCYLVKPDIEINDFMYVHGQELMSILDEGLDIEEIGHLNFSLVGFTADTPALHKFCKHTNFNGRFGCFFVILRALSLRIDVIGIYNIRSK